MPETVKTLITSIPYMVIAAIVSGSDVILFTCSVNPVDPPDSGDLFKYLLGLLEAVVCPCFISLFIEHQTLIIIYFANTYLSVGFFHDQQ